MFVINSHTKRKYNESQYWEIAIFISIIRSSFFFLKTENKKQKKNQTNRFVATFQSTNYSYEFSILFRYIYAYSFSFFVVIDCVFTIYSAWIVYIYPFIEAGVCAFIVNRLCLFPISTDIVYIHEYVFPIN